MKKRGHQLPLLAGFDGAVASLHGQSFAQRLELSALLLLVVRRLKEPEQAHRVGHLQHRRLQRQAHVKRRPPATTTTTTTTNAATAAKLELERLLERQRRGQPHGHPARRAAAHVQVEHSDARRRRSGVARPRLEDTRHFR